MLTNLILAETVDDFIWIAWNGQVRVRFKVKGSGQECPLHTPLGTRPMFSAENTGNQGSKSGLSRGISEGPAHGSVKKLRVEGCRVGLVSGVNQLGSRAKRL